MVGVYTRSYTNYRDGAYIDPALKLTSSYVQSNGVKVVGNYQLDDPRGTEGQVLIAPNIKVRSGVTRDLAVIADMSNNIYGFNAQPPFNLIWKQPIGNPMSVMIQQDMWGINPFWGVLSTGVIDPDTGLWFIVSLTTPDGSYNNSAYFFHTISLADGSAAYPPIALNNVSYKAPSGTAKQFGAAVRKQRAALTLTRSPTGVKTVYIPFGSFAETSISNLGWIVAIDVTAAPKIAKAWATGDKYIGAGVWMAGAGLSVGDDGSLHGMTGNGGFDPPGDLGECFFKLDRDLNPKQWWSPYSDAGRAGLDPTLPTQSGALMQKMAAMTMPGMVMDDGGPNNAMNAMMVAMAGDTSNVHKVGDQDLGSGGPLYLPTSLTGYTKNILLGGGKDGILWLLDADAMGNTMPNDFQPGNIAENYKHLLFPPWGWTFNGVGQNLMPINLDELPIAVGGYTRHVHGQPVAYLSPDHGLLTFVQGENGPVRAVRIDANGAPSYIACGTEIASAGMPPPGGMPGGMLSLAVTAQKANTSVLWACMPLNGDANKYVVAGRLVAYASNWVQNGNLIKLWDSNDWGIGYSHNKFNIATAQADKLFVPTYDGRVLIFG